MLGLVIRLAAIVLVVCVVWWTLRPRFTLVIVIGSKGVKHHRGLPKAREASVLEYFSKHRSFDGDVTICAIRQADGRLRVVFKGHVEPETRQQIRNFLITVM